MSDQDRLLNSVGGTDSGENEGTGTRILAQPSDEYPLYPPTSAAYGPPHVARMDTAEAVPFTWAEVSDNNFDHHHQPYVYGQV